MKKGIKIVLVGAACAAVIIGGGYGITRVIKSNASPVEVTKVSYLTVDWWYEDSGSSYGTITSNAVQEVTLESEELVSEVYVKEGDTVKIGDALLAYDKTLLELELESAQLSKQTMDLELKGLENDLNKLNATTPVSDSAEAASFQQNKIEILATDSSSSKATEETESESSTETETATDAETETETEAETETPLDKIKAKKKLNYKSKPYKGSGTKEDPYVFFCIDGATIEASFMNKVLGYNEAGTSKKNGGMNEDGQGCYVVLEIREGDSVSGGFVKSVSINGTSKADKAYAPGVTWTFTSEGLTKNEMTVDEPEDEDEDESEDWNDDDVDWSDDSETYTAAELKQAIADKETEIKEKKISIREAELLVQQSQRKLDEATVTASINGTVQTVGDPELGQVDDEPFLTVNSDQGLYVRGTVSELELDSIEVGAVVQGVSQDSGLSFWATITEISQYPDSGEDYYSWGGNANASNYPFMAYIEEAEGLSNYEYVSINVQSDSETDVDALYIEKAYVRSENGQSYVWIADSDKRLKKQYIKTGDTLEGYYVQIKEGLKLTDSIAFPYGSNVKEGAKTVNADGDDEDEVLDDSAGLEEIE